MEFVLFVTLLFQGGVTQEFAYTSYPTMRSCRSAAAIQEKRQNLIEWPRKINGGLLSVRAVCIPAAPNHQS